MPCTRTCSKQLATCNQSHQWHRCRFMVAGVNGPISEELWQRVKMKSQPANWVSVMKLDTQKGKGCMHSSESQKSQQWGAPPGGSNFYSLPIFAMLPSCKLHQWQQMQNRPVLSHSHYPEHTLSLSLYLSLSLPPFISFCALLCNCFKLISQMRNF